MTLSQIVQIGEMLEIKVKDTVTKTKLQDIHKNERFSVLQPTFRLAPVSMEKNEQVKFTFVRHNGIYSFHAVFEKRIKRDNLKLCIFRAVSEVEKNQRRYAYRLTVELDVLIRPEEPETGEESAAKAKILNLSERGALINCEAPFKKGAGLTMQVYLEKDDFLNVKAQVVRREGTLVSVQFLDISEKDQSHIRRYILNKQIIQRKLQKQKSLPL